MAKVTSKLQVTIPKALAKRAGIAPGDEIEWSAAGEGIAMRPAEKAAHHLSTEERLELFDAATARHRRRMAKSHPSATAVDRGWTRADLYDDRTRRH